MRKLYAIFIAALSVAACYPDYVGDYEVVACGFANQVDVRSVIVGEKMEFSTGVALGGVIENNSARKVDFSTDYSLVTNNLLSQMKVHTFTYIQALAKQMTSVSVLPASMYNLETAGKAGEAVIAKGSHLGTIVVRIDEEAFTADEGNVLPKYILPLRITKAHGCGIIEGKETTCIGVRYENTLFGNWYHGGVATVTDESGNVLETIEYPIEIPMADSKVWTLTTVAPHSLTANAVGSELNSSSAQMKLTLGVDGRIAIESVEGAKYVVEADGESSYNQAKLLQDREVYLKYKYAKDGKIYHVSDTLQFRNRIRDGVNEWQDENQENY